MRSTGIHRGNPMLRASIEQCARRRLEAMILPNAGGDDPHDRADAREHPFTRAFFDRVIEHVLPRMAPALAIDGAELRYFAGGATGLWGLRAELGLVIAYECADTPQLLAERAKRWLACLRTRTTPGVLARTWGRPVYGARHDPESGEFDIVWATPGEWCGSLLESAAVAEAGRLPEAWPVEVFAGS